MGRRRKRNTREKMCVRFTLIIANSLLALLGLLLLAGGVWRIVDDGSLREVANGIVDGLEEAVKEAASHKYSRSPPSCSSMLTTPTSASSRRRLATRLPRSTSRTLRSWLPGRSLCRTCSSGSPLAFPPSSSSSQSPSAVERGGRRECKDMLRQYRLD